MKVHAFNGKYREQMRYYYDNLNPSFYDLIAEIDALAKSFNLVWDYHKKQFGYDEYTANLNKEEGETNE